MLMYIPSILSIIHPEPSLTHIVDLVDYRFSSPVDLVFLQMSHLNDIFDLLLFLLVN